MRRRALLFVVDDAPRALEYVAELLRSRALNAPGFGWQPEPATSPLQRLLRDDGYEVGLTLAGRDTSRRLRDAPAPDALVIDVSTTLGGGALEHAFEARMIYPNLPVLIVTSQPESVQAALGLLRPRALVFTKPVDYTCLGFELGRAARGHAAEFVRLPGFAVEAGGRTPAQS